MRVWKIWVYLCEVNFKNSLKWGCKIKTEGANNIFEK